MSMAYIGNASISLKAALSEMEPHNWLIGTHYLAFFTCKLQEVWFSEFIPIEL